MAFAKSVYLKQFSIIITLYSLDGFFQDLHYFPRFPSIRRPLTIDEALMDSELENC